MPIPEQKQILAIQNQLKARYVESINIHKKSSQEWRDSDEGDMHVIQGAVLGASIDAFEDALKVFEILFGPIED